MVQFAEVAESRPFEQFPAYPMNDLQATQGFLGGTSFLPMVPQSELDFLPAIRDGFSWASMDHLVEKTGFPESVLLLGLGIPKRTLARRKESNHLTPSESEAVLRVARAFVMARRVLGDEEKAREWLVRPNRALGGEAPMALLRYDIGFQEVLDVLGRIEYGVYS